MRASVTILNVIPQRIVLAIMACLGIVNVYGARTSLSFIITKMVVQKNHSITSSYECPAEAEIVQSSLNSTTFLHDTATDQYQRFDWSEQLQGIILASFYVGYLISHIPGGLLASHFGGKWVLLISVGMNSILTFITPYFVFIGGAPALIVLRIFIGLFEGVVMPTIAVLLAAWVPLSERSRISSFVYSGIQLGVVFGSILSGYLLNIYSGWTAPYYVFGSIGSVWCLIFFLICYSDPKSHPFIKQEEKTFLLKELGQLQRDKCQPSTPWRSICRSSAFWSHIIVQFGFGFSFFIMSINLPKYMADVLKFSIFKNGLLSALPFFTMWLFGMLSSVLGDFLINRSYLTITSLRKCCAVLCVFGPAVSLIGASYAGCDKIISVSCFVLGVGVMGLFLPGVKANVLDLAPNYAGAVMGVANMVCSTSGVLAPYIVGALTPNGLMKEWRNVFWLNFIVSLPTSVACLIWYSGRIQPWNNPITKSGKNYEENSVISRL